MPYTARTFRVFVSSTFEDLTAERNALQDRVFPRLRALCAARGARFQAIDLRWGISEEAALDERSFAYGAYVHPRPAARSSIARAPAGQMLNLLGGEVERTLRSVNKRSNGAAYRSQRRTKVVPMRSTPIRGIGVRCNRASTTRRSFTTGSQDRPGRRAGYRACWHLFPPSQCHFVCQSALVG
jgi:hypothetical protein